MPCFPKLLLLQPLRQGCEDHSFHGDRFSERSFPKLFSLYKSFRDQQGGTRRYDKCVTAGPDPNPLTLFPKCTLEEPVDV
jgi:hypothetical protein